MEWTDESIIAEFEKHLPYWQEKLRLRDISFTVKVVASIEGSPNAWCHVARANCEDNFYAANIFISRSQLAGTTPRDVWETVAHEMVHVMNWAMSAALEPMKDHLSVSQRNMANALLARGNEILSYKWEAILGRFFAADAPQPESTNVQ